MEMSKGESKCELRLVLKENEKYFRFFYLFESIIRGLGFIFSRIVSKRYYINSCNSNPRVSLTFFVTLR